MKYTKSSALLQQVLTGIEVEPWRLKRWLDYFSKQDPHFIPRSYKKLYSQIAAIRRAEAKTLERDLQVDTKNLWRAIGEGAKTDHQVEITLDYGEDMMSIGRGSKVTELEIFSPGSGFDFWIIPAGGPEIFHPAQEHTLVYLYLPFPRDSNNEVTRKVEMCIEDRFLWFDDKNVVAQGEMSYIHEDSIVVAKKGLIIPVTVELFPHRFAAFPPVSEESDEDEKEELESLLNVKDPFIEAYKELPHWLPPAGERPLPRLPIEPHTGFGHWIMNDIQESAISRTW